MEPPKKLSSAARVGLLYLFFGGVWIVVTDRALAVLAENPGAWQTLKGWGFVVFSAVLIYALVRRESLVRERTEAILSDLLEIMPDPMLVRGLEDGTVTEVNRGFAEQVGMEREEILGKELAELPIGFRDEDREELERRLDEEGEVRNFPLRVIVGDEERVHLLSSRVVEMEDGRYVVSVAKDITDRHRAEAEIRASERRYRKLFEQNVAGTFRTTLDGEILECNEAFARMFGFDSPEEMEGRNALELYKETGDRERYLRRLRDEGTLAGVELQLKRRDGTPLWVLESSFLVESPERDEPVNMGTLVDIDERKRLEAELQRMAYHDSLTGLANRRLLRAQAERALSLGARRGEEVGLVYLDLAQFKSINDRFGHDAGDQVLAEVARRLRARCRESDVPARIGGDEFAVLLSEVGDVDGAVAAARRLKEGLGEPFHVGQRSVKVEARIGVAVYPRHASNYDQLLTRADQAMYRARGRGQEEIRIHLPPAEGEWDREMRRELEDDLQRAVEEESFCLFYQPIRTRTGEPAVGAEALLRWRHPEHGLMDAGEFVPLLERLRLIGEVDRWVLGQAVTQAVEWADEGGPEWVAVNLSAQTFQARKLAEHIEGLLESRGLSGKRLVLEVSERAAMRETDQATRTIARLRKTGVTVAIDDFGTGHAALAYLKHFAPKLIKTDIVFVREVADSPPDRELIRGISELAHGLGMKVVAEGVETEEQYRRVVEAGVDLVQGFYTGGPVPPEELLGEAAGPGGEAVGREAGG